MSISGWRDWTVYQSGGVADRDPEELLCVAGVALCCVGHAPRPDLTWGVYEAVTDVLNYKAHLLLNTRNSGESFIFDLKIV